MGGSVGGYAHARLHGRKIVVSDVCVCGWVGVLAPARREIIIFLSSAPVFLLIVGPRQIFGHLMISFFVHMFFLRFRYVSN